MFRQKPFQILFSKFSWKHHWKWRATEDLRGSFSTRPAGLSEASMKKTAPNKVFRSAHLLVSLLQICWSRSSKIQHGIWLSPKFAGGKSPMLWWAFHVPCAWFSAHGPTVSTGIIHWDVPSGPLNLHRPPQCQRGWHIPWGPCSCCHFRPSGGCWYQQRMV